ncbi:MAG TPA: aminotransferase class I/II-fold pyridoxal phosphate-dependent enzyme [Chloroflexota bacterium]|nr:aminotransferase class I/II-fold pyridoxal phosphate-dependent enzyme [Chloroflexota bacterium]
MSTTWRSHSSRGVVDLAIFGGRPAFSEQLHVGRPNTGNRDRLYERIDSILSRRWLSNGGPFVREFEQRICELVGVRHCVATCNGTAALEIGIRALGLTGEVIVPSFTFVATAHALKWQGISPVFCDVDPHTHNLDPAKVEALITPRTTGILGVHLWGRACAIERLEEVARRHRLMLLFDAAHAFACSYNRQMVGNFGSLEAFSFHATKFLNTFEGGAVVTNDNALAAKLRAIQNFGFADHDEVTDVGINAKLNEVSAAMGLTGLESLDEVIAVNHANYNQYRAKLQGVPGISVALFDEREKSNFQYVVVEVDEAAAQLTRDQLMAILHAENVLARRYFYPGCHRAAPYRTAAPDAGAHLPVTDALSNRVLVLPTGTAVNPEDAGRVCDIVRLAVAHGPEICQRLSRRPELVLASR